MDDLSWWEVDDHEGWVESSDLSGVVQELMHEAGTTYAPFMIANAEALESGSDEVVCEIRGAEYRQAPFDCQAKCLAWLCEAYDALDAALRATLDRTLSGTGCDRLAA